MEDSGKSRLQLYQKLQQLIDSDENNVAEFEKVTTDLRKLGNEQDESICEQILQTAQLRSGHCDALLNKLEQRKNKDPFTYIYALHALDKQNSALTNIDALNIDKSEYYANMLYAQILYKLDQREKATETYESILNSNDSHLENDHNEVIVNLLASL